MRRHADGQFHHLADATLGEQCDGALDRFAVAADHDLAGRVVVRRYDHLAVGGQGAHLGHQRILGAQHGRHRADARRCGVLHQLPAQAHQVRAILQRERTRGDQCGVLAQAVPGQQRRRGSALLLPCAPHGDAGGQQRRLGVFGAVEHFLGAALRQRPQVHTRAVGGFGERLAHDRMQLGQFGQHADGLRTLARKHESEMRGSHSDTLRENRPR